LLSVRFIRFAKLTALLADVSTIFSAVLIVGWQIVILLKDGSWPALPLSLILTPKIEVYSTASIEKNGESHQATNFIDVLLQVPIIMLLLWYSSQRFTYRFQASKENSLKRKSNKSCDSVSQETYPRSSETQAKSDHRNGPNPINDWYGRGRRRTINCRRSFVRDFAHGHFLIPGLGQIALNA